MSDEQPDQSKHRLTRRQTLGVAGAAGSAVVLGGGAGKVISALIEDPDEVTAATAAKSCRLTPEVTEGPFYVALDKIRRDITESKPGVPLTLKIRVVDVKRCARSTARPSTSGIATPAGSTRTRPRTAPRA